MIKNVVLSCLLVASVAFAQTGPGAPAVPRSPLGTQSLEQRIGHTDPTKATPCMTAQVRLTSIRCLAQPLLTQT
jgi:hypothetical protein